MKDDITQIKILLAEIKSDLKYHIKRTDLLDGELKHMRKDMEPVEAHVRFVTSLGKLLAVLVAGAAAIAGILRNFI